MNVVEEERGKRFASETAYNGMCNDHYLGTVNTIKGATQVFAEIQGFFFLLKSHFLHEIQLFCKLR